MPLGFLAFFGLLLLSRLAVAIPYTGVSELVRDGRIVFESQPAVSEYRLVLSSIKKVNSQWRATEKVIPKALVARMTIELDGRTHYEEAKKQLQRDMAAAADMTPLFQCSGLDCGSSNGWANEFLRVKQLYGMDTNQFYVVQAGLDAGKKETYVVWYLVQRGNGRIYLQQDVVHAGPDAGAGTSFSQEVWFEHLLREGYFVMPGVVLNGGEPKAAGESIDLLVNLLKGNPQLILRLVGHEYSAASLAERERRSLFYAQWLRDRITDRGVSADRITAHGVGNLAPGGRLGEARIEVVRD